MSLIQPLQHDFDWAMRAVRTHRAVLVLDLAGYIVAVNDYCLRIYGYRREELIGRPVVLLLDPAEKGPNRLCQLLETPDAHEVQLHDLAQITKSGRRLRVDARLCPILDKGDICLNVLFIREASIDGGPMLDELQPGSARIIHLPFCHDAPAPARERQADDSIRTGRCDSRTPSSIN